MANYHGSLEAVHCHILSLRYDVVVNGGTGGRLNGPIRSPRRCSDAVTSNKWLSREKDASILSWPTIMGHLKLCIAIFTA
eukprot:scaffold29332_cov80-Skeletonema_dohrnii-CCMP3373.AAC.4